ncbi:MULTISPECIES: thioesterase family protein [Acinetobacter]|uniref:acyl-CoA thioesterase n=1 Tax=Acinetobacter TaxID=469 RepID=UPI001443B5CF|nr:thioesterase family protein [Acinetobacter towneri]
MKPEIKTRNQYTFFVPIQTRWADNDMYGHVNNVTYYSYFDSTANALLIQKAGFEPKRSPCIGLVVSSTCHFLQELSYPEVIEVGVAIQKIGNSSLIYDLAIFKHGQQQASAQGQVVHVFVERNTRQSFPIPQNMREALQAYMSVDSV